MLYQSLIRCPNFRVHRTFSWCYLVGQKASNAKPIQNKKHGRKVCSLFRFGLDLLRRALLGTDGRMGSFEISRYFRTLTRCLQQRPTMTPGWSNFCPVQSWGTYSRALDEGKHVVGKKNTQKIERKNLNLRTWIKRLARKTICFSKTEIMHDTVIGHS